MPTYTAILSVNAYTKKIQLRPFHRKCRQENFGVRLQVLAKIFLLLYLYY